MKLLFDQNISYRILKKLSDFFRGSSHVTALGLMNSSDLEIWEYAKNNQYTIVTQDSDFNDIYLIKGFPPKVIWIKTGNMDTEQIAQLFIKHQPDIEEFFLDDNLGCFEIFRFN